MGKSIIDLLLLLVVPHLGYMLAPTRFIYGQTIGTNMNIRDRWPLYTIRYWHGFVIGSINDHFQTRLVPCLPRPLYLWPLPTWPDKFATQTYSMELKVSLE